MPTTCQVLENTKVNEKRHDFKELTALSSRERGDEGGLSRYVEFYWAEIAIERSKGHFMGEDQQEPKSGWGRVWSLIERSVTTVEESYR